MDISAEKRTDGQKVYEKLFYMMSQSPGKCKLKPRDTPTRMATIRKRDNNKYW